MASTVTASFTPHLASDCFAMTRARAFDTSALRGEWPHAVFIGLALWVLYLLTAPRTVVLEDDGLFVLSSWFLGIEHPPGYPLYVLLGKLATLWPWGEPAWRVHALSGLFGAIACSAVYLTGRLLNLGRPAAYLAGLGLGVSATFWSQAIIADVYSLNALIFFALLLLALGVGQPRGAGRIHGRLADASALISGLGVANHWPLLLQSAPGLALLWWPAWRLMLHRLPILLVWFCVGLLPYAWMVWRSQMQPEVSFQGSIDTCREFTDYMLRHGYVAVDNNAAASFTDKLLYLSYSVRDAGSQLWLQWAVLALVGFFAQSQRWGRLTAWGAR